MCSIRSDCVLLRLIWVRPFCLMLRVNCVIILEPRRRIYIHFCTLNTISIWSLCFNYRHCVLKSAQNTYRLFCLSDRNINM